MQKSCEKSRVVVRIGGTRDMTNTWYIGERVRAMCDRCGEIFQTKVISASGSTINKNCRKCKRDMIIESRRKIQ